MRLWKVKVVGYWLNGKKIMRSTRWILLEANSSDNAMQAGLAFVESTAAFGLNWKSFEAMEAATVNLPLNLDSK